MSVESQIVKVTYSGNGVTKLFPITFKYNTPDEVGLYYTDLLGVLTKITTNFEVNTVTNKVTYPVDVLILPPIAVGTKLTLIRETSITQGLELESQGYFTPKEAEKAFDKITRIAQELNEKLSRAVSFPLNETPDSSTTDTFLQLVYEARDAALEYKNAAEVSAESAASLYSSFDRRYLGAKATDPELDNEGFELLEGCLYFNSTTKKMRVWTGVLWDLFGTSSAQNKFILENAQATLVDIVGLVFDSTKETSVSLRLEIERIGLGVYRQVMNVDALFTGFDWVLTFGNSSGPDIIQYSELTSDESIMLSITEDGQVQYLSGDLPGHEKTILKVYQTRMDI